MSGWDEARSVEVRSIEILRPVIRQKAWNGQYVATAKGPLSKDLQKSAGDFLFNTDADTVFGVEVKAEETCRHGNFFLETWSNRARFTPGWMFNLNTDLLLYHFLDEDLLYRIPFKRLRVWAFHEGKIYAFPEKKQGKYVQLNDTWGRCVPIVSLTADLSLALPLRPVADFGRAEKAA